MVAEMFDASLALSAVPWQDDIAVVDRWRGRPLPDKSALPDK